MNQEQLRQLAEKILQQAESKGATAAELAVDTATGFSVSVRKGELESIEHNDDKSLDLTVYFGQRSGSASTADFSDAALNSTVQKACDIARFTTEDHYAGLAPYELMAFNYSALDLYHPWHITPKQATDLALRCEFLALNANKRITNSEGASIHTHEYLHLYANSYNFLGMYPSTSHGINCALIAEQHGQMERDYDYTVSRQSEALTDITVLAGIVAEKTIQRLGAQRLTTRSAPVIFAPVVARSLIQNFLSAISGGNLYRKSSFLLDSLNTQIFPEFISLYEKPHLLKGLGSAPFDDEGVLTQDRSLVENGVLTTYLLSSYSARKLGMQSTGHAGGTYNIFVSTSDNNLSQLLKNMGTGLLVTEMMGQGVNLVNGDFSRGVFGFWVENGEIKYPVHEITIAGNLKNMFKDIVAIACDVDERSRIQTGSILVEKMMIAGQ